MDPGLTNTLERVILYLKESDADVLVDVLQITSEEILERFEDKVIRYVEAEVG